MVVQTGNTAVLDPIQGLGLVTYSELTKLGANLDRDAGYHGLFVIALGFLPLGVAENRMRYVEHRKLSAGVKQTVPVLSGEGYLEPASEATHIPVLIVRWVRLAHTPRTSRGTSRHHVLLRPKQPNLLTPSGGCSLLHLCLLNGLGHVRPTVNRDNTHSWAHRGVVPHVS